MEKFGEFFVAFQNFCSQLIIGDIYIIIFDGGAKDNSLQIREICNKKIFCGFDEQSVIFITKYTPLFVRCGGGGSGSGGDFNVYVLVQNENIINNTKGTETEMENCVQEFLPTSMRKQSHN